MPARRLNDRHPFEVYLLLALLVSAAPAAFGFAQVPQSVEGLVSPIVGRLWVITLWAGCFVALLGLAWKRPPFPRVSVTGLLLEQVGLTIAGSASILYGAIIVQSAGVRGLISAGAVAAFGLASLAQAIKIRYVLATATKVQP